MYEILEMEMFLVKKGKRKKLSSNLNLLFCKHVQDEPHHITLRIDCNFIKEGQ